MMLLFVQRRKAFPFSQLSTDGGTTVMDTRLTGLKVLWLLFSLRLFVVLHVILVHHVGVDHLWLYIILIVVKLLLLMLLVIVILEEDRFSHVHNTCHTPMATMQQMLAAMCVLPFAALIISAIAGRQLQGQRHGSKMNRQLDETLQ